ncbi:MAG: DUF1622 domain-containing protein [Thiobacillus sp.]|jgi:uncharacterized membrane protein|uniref:DUF1622 domain-containing protein n=1 Tax=Thiobacillus sp. TaxID=924 RepID=UPI002894E237|nr:DUF1622 domain-containing protein [Thiobacillus sp.]MDT3706221.1 DUF1622 domain-containing protein [Thiobacillus sp.]
MHELLVQWVGYVVPWIEALGIVVVLWGVLEAFLGLARRGWLAAQRAARKDLGVIRLAMGEKMVLGLEFFLAGDIVQTIVVPTWNSLAILGGIVVIRTVIVYFLNLEPRRGARQGSV